MKARSLVTTFVLAALASATVASIAHAGEAKFSEDEQIGGTFETLPISPRYPRPSGVGGIDAMPPASALTPIPPNVLNCRHDYALGEASVSSEGYVGGDAKGRASMDRHVRHRTRTAWGRHAYD